MKTFAPWLLGIVALTSACNGEGPVASPSELSISPAALEFGAVSITGESTLDITVTNAGGGELSVLSVTLTEGDTDDWSVDKNGLTSLAGGTSGTVSVTFTPEDQRPYTGAVQIRTDAASGEPSVTVNLTGTGGESDADYDYDGYSAADGDCDDGNPYVNPGASEVCDGVDNDCNGSLLGDEVDDDSDGWLLCEGDCDDENSEINPGEEEVCDGLDNDCDNVTPDNDDVDADGYSLCDGDCDDNESRANPARAEVCDGVDNDCEGTVDVIDADADGHTVCSATGDCDDNDPNAFPVVVSTSGSSYGTGTDNDPYDSLATALASLDLVCRTVILEPGTYTDVSEPWSSGQVLLIGRSGVASDVILEATAYDRHFAVSGGATLALESLTLTGGQPAGDGGAIQVSSSTLDLENVVLENNTAGADGGAIAVTPGTLTLGNGIVVRNNVATDDGGAIHAAGATITDTQGTLYEGNAGTYGGALRLEGGTVTIREATFDGNAATEGGALSLSGAGTYVLERNAIWSNTADDGAGIALQGVDSAAGYLRNNRLQDNVAQANGGGLAVLGPTVMRIHNNTLTGNETVGGEGAGIYAVATDLGGLQIVSNVLDENDGASGVYVTSDPYLAPIVSHNTAYRTNSGTDFAGDPVDASNNTSDPLLGSISDDGDPTNDDLALQAGSPMVDSGPAQAGFDDTDGSQNDRGYTGGPAAQ